MKVKTKKMGRVLLEMELNFLFLENGEIEINKEKISIWENNWMMIWRCIIENSMIS